jgi:predicted phospho-2-dehydro-3-deoxyheptonate aldolase
MTGIPLRLRRIAHDGRFVLIPMDHGTSNGPIPGIAQIRSAIHAADDGGATGIVLHKGLAKDYASQNPRAGLLIHISASTQHAPDPHDKRLVGTAHEALTLGADALSLHTNVGSTTEARQLEDLGRATQEAHALGLPVLAMMYPRGPHVKDPYREDLVAHAARLGEELGADLVKTLYTGDVHSLRNVVSSLSVPLLVAGGAKSERPIDVLQLVHDAMKAGAMGVSIGRNAFQHTRPQAMVRALRALVIDHASVSDAKSILEKAKPR